MKLEETAKLLGDPDPYIEQVAWLYGKTTGPSIAKLYLFKPDFCQYTWISIYDDSPTVLAETVDWLLHSGHASWWDYLTMDWTAQASNQWQVSTPEQIAGLITGGKPL